MGAERIEAQVTVPAGVTVSASNGAQTSAVTCTITAGTYYPTTLAAMLQTQLNDNVQGYPLSAAAMAAAVGYGTWSAGWLCNESATPLVPVFGTPDLTAVSTPTYLTAGPRGGIDYAVGLDSSGDGFTGGNVHDVGATDDLIIAWVGKWTTAPGDFTALISKGTGADGWIVYHNAGVLKMEGSASSSGTVALPTVGNWHAGIAVIDRGASLMRIGVVDLTTGTVTVGSTGATQASYTSAASFVVGGGGGWLANGASPFLLAGLWVGKGLNYATGMASGLSTALDNFRQAINSSFTVSLSTTTGLVSVSNSFWPSYVTFSSTLRSTLGFAYDFD
jgi:hypothetical protein